MGKLVPYSVDINTLSPIDRKLRENCENKAPRRVKRAVDQFRVDNGRPPLWFLPRDRAGKVAG